MDKEAILADMAMVFFGTDFVFHKTHAKLAHDWQGSNNTLQG